MSIIESLVKVIDPVQAKQREEERKTAREQPKRGDCFEVPHAVCLLRGLGSIRHRPAFHCRNGASGLDGEGIAPKPEGHWQFVQRAGREMQIKG